MEYMGKPDGSTESLKNFIALAHETEIDFSSLQHRVIVGRKGSGKSLCIRKFYQESQRDNSRFAIEITNRAPNLEGVINFSATMENRVRTNTWQSIWEYAILITAITHILYDRDYESKFRSNIDKKYLESIEYEFSNCLLGLRTPTQVYDVINVIVHYFEDSTKFANFIYTPIVLNFRSTCSRILRSSAPICIYLDSLDDELRRAPSALTDITRALFYTVVKSARDTDAIPNIHTMITMRDVVFSTIMTSDHADRFLDTNYVIFLFWSPKKSHKFIDAKITQTQKRLNEKSSKWLKSTRDLNKLLGFDQITNEEKDCKENTAEYFLRHTNFVPRNTIRFGNRIYREIDSNGSIDPKKYQEIVNNISKEIAEALITATSAYLVAASYDDDVSYLVELDESMRDYLSKGPISDRTVREVMSNMQSSLTDGFIPPIKSFISYIGKDVFTKEMLQSALNEFTKENKDYNTMVQNYNFNKLENILWIQGLIGIRDRGGANDTFYYFSDTNEQTSLPTNAETYVFFPGLNDVCRLEIEPGRPVGPKMD